MNARPPAIAVGWYTNWATSWPTIMTKFRCIGIAFVFLARSEPIPTFTSNLGGFQDDGSHFVLIKTRTTCWVACRAACQTETKFTHTQSSWRRIPHPHTIYRIVRYTSACALTQNCRSLQSNDCKNKMFRVQIPIELAFATSNFHSCFTVKIACLLP